MSRALRQEQGVMRSLILGCVVCRLTTKKIGIRSQNVFGCLKEFVDTVFTSRK